jgi:probable HAF family extracellular repeat protein
MPLRSHPIQLAASLGVLCSVPACSSGGAHVASSGAALIPAGAVPNAASFASPDLKFKFTAITIPDAKLPTAWALNNRGAIGGWYYDSMNIRHGYVYAKGTLKNIDDPKGVNTQVLGINDRGDVVGAYTSPSGSNHGFLYSHGKYKDVGLGVRSGANGINNLGQMVGVYGDCTSVCMAHGFLYDGKTYTSFDVPNAVDTAPSSINDAGLMTVISPDQNAVYHSYLYDGHTFTKIDIPGKTATFAQGINSDSDIAFSWDGPASTSGAALLHKGKYFFFSYPGASTTYVGDINDHHVIVGTYFTPSLETGIFQVKY